MSKRPPHPRGTAQQLRKALPLAAVGVIAVLALMSSGAQATGGARIAAACSNETVNGGKYVEVLTLRGELTLRFVLIGSVTCDEAHRLVRAYFGKMAADQQCGTRNSFCELQFAGGWDCFVIPAAQSQDGASAGCARTGAKIRLYKVTRRTAKRSCGTERVQPGTLGPPKTGSTSGPGIPYKIIVWRGKVSCRKARSLIKATGEGKGTWHEAPDIAAIYTSFPGGWRCALVNGGDYGCVRGRRIGASGYTDEVDGIQQL
ncbi:MAG TPA: hypothetical protein VMT50_04165 [Steroidobacteraceae bacterium]|nr:hypothetical protein [Steroidobacteraceae bacterium]